MKLSFAIPFYSTPEYLDAAVRSVLAQTYQDWELVIVDDRSPYEGIKEQVAQFNDPRISYHLNDKNLGQSGNWNECLRLAKNDLVTLLHADDMLMPNYAETMVEAATKDSGSSGFFCNAIIVDGLGNEIFSFADFYKKFLLPSRNEIFEVSGENGLRSLIKGNFIMCPTMCYRKSMLRNTAFSPDWKCAPDLDFVSRLLVAGGSLKGIPVTAFKYRRHEESGTAIFRKNRQQFDEEIRLYNEIAKRAESVGWKMAAQEGRNKRIVKLRLGYFGIKDLFSLRIVSSFDKLSLAARLLIKES